MVVILFISGLASAAAKTSKLTAKIVGYDLMRHASKAASHTQNQEIVILETTGAKDRYVKVLFSSFGTSQIDSKYFDGTMPMEVEVFRDHSCDESAPTFVSQASPNQIAGSYLLTDAFKSHPPAKIKTLACYVAIYRKQ